MGPSPTDRGKAGTKRHQIVDRRGLPLSLVLSGANVPDGKRMTEALEAIPKVQGRRGRPKSRPRKLHGDKAYDDKALRRALRERGITPRLSRRGADTGQRLGRYRWSIERTISWQQGFRRLRTRDEKRDDIHEALGLLADALICWGRLNGHYC